MKRAAGTLREAYRNRLVAGRFLRPLAQLKQCLIGVLTNIWEDAVKGNVESLAEKPATERCLVLGHKAEAEA